MGTHRSKHHKGRKPVYKEHRFNLVASPEAEAEDTADGLTPDAFLLSEATQALSLADVEKLTEDEALLTFQRLRWPDGPRCPNCNCASFYKLESRHRSGTMTCRLCHRQYSPVSGTVFAHRKIPYRKLLAVLVSFVRRDPDTTLSEISETVGMHPRATAMFSKKFLGAIAPKEAAEQYTLARPRYQNSGWYSTRTWWSPAEKLALTGFIKRNVLPDAAADALGRSPSSLIHYARDMRVKLPPAWRIIAGGAGPRRIELQYPYILKARPEHADLLQVNALVPKTLGGDMRADICQEIMLALFEGRTTLDELKAHRDETHFFVKKFYRDNFEQGGKALSLAAFDGENRSYDEIASSIAARDWREADMNEKRLAWDAQNISFTPPSQVADVFLGQVLDYQTRQHLVGDHVSFEEAFSEADTDEFHLPHDMDDAVSFEGRHRFRGMRGNDDEHARHAVARRSILWKEQKGRCCYCRRLTRLPEDASAPTWLPVATLEHRNPKAAGGPKFDRANLAMSCQYCNIDKADMPEEEFLSRLAA